VASFEDIDKARKLLGLEQFASLEEMKQAYRNKAFLYHPDMSGSENTKDDKMMKSLNQAHKLLMEYCSRYKYSFKEEDVDRTFSDEAYVRRYVYGWFEGM
jgi:DnaJ-class molecular chaperone